MNTVWICVLLKAHDLFSLSAFNGRSKEYHANACYSLYSFISIFIITNIIIIKQTKEYKWLKQVLPIAKAIQNEQLDDFEAGTAFPSGADEFTTGF